MLGPRAANPPQRRQTKPGHPQTSSTARAGPLPNQGQNLNPFFEGSNCLSARLIQPECQVAVPQIGISALPRSVHHGNQAVETK